MQQRLGPHGINYNCSKEARSCTFDLRVKHRSASVRTLPPASSTTFMATRVILRHDSVSRFSFVSWNTESNYVRVRKILTLGCAGAVWLQRETSVSPPLRRQPTFRVKVDNAAVGLAPRTQIHSSSFHNVGLAGVGLGSTNQNTETKQKAGNNRSLYSSQLLILDKSCWSMRPKG